MKLWTWTATPAGHRMTLTGADESGTPVTIDDVREIRNDQRSGRTFAVLAEDDVEVELS